MGATAERQSWDARRERYSGPRVAALVFLISTFLGLFFAAQIYFSAASFRRQVSWGQALYWSFGDWYEWALLAPVIFWLCRRFPFDRQAWKRSLPVHVAGGLLLAAVHGGLCALAALIQGAWVGVPRTFSEEWRQVLANRTHYNLAVFAVIVCAWHAWVYHRRFREREAQAADLAGRLAQVQLQALRMQLNPHFLFNTLNAISGLMLKDVVAANRMISRLGDLLRLALEGTDQQEVPLRQEVEFARRYLEIEQIRFGDRLQVEMGFDPSTLDAAVPNLILQPLVENAIRHAIEPQVAAGRIEFRSVRENGTLVLQVSDNGPGLDAGSLRKADGDGRERIGLVNTRERLRRLYGGLRGLELVGNPMGGVTAIVSIPFRLMPGDGPRA